MKFISPNDELLTTEEACQFLRVNRWTLRRLRLNGTIPKDAYFRLGNRPRCELRYSKNALTEALFIGQAQCDEYNRKRAAERRAAKEAKGGTTTTLQ